MYNEKAIISQWIADMYDWNETYTDDVEFALTLMGEEPKRVQEIACGSGRIMIPMAKAGHYVVGLDFDEFMLNKIAAKVTNEKLEWHKADVISEEWATEFDVVVLGANFLYNIVSDLSYEQAQKLVIQEELLRLSDAHYRKIDLSDGIYVVNIDGYIGESVKKEIEYAEKHGKEILYHYKW